MSLLQLLATISRSPRLACSMERLELLDQRLSIYRNDKAILSSHSTTDDSEAAILNLEASLKPEIQRLCEDSGDISQTEGVQLRQGLEQRNWDAVATFVLLSLPTLRYLKLSGYELVRRVAQYQPNAIKPHPEGYNYVRWAFQRAERLQRSHGSIMSSWGAMEKLENLELKFMLRKSTAEARSCVRPRLSQLICFLTLPSIRTLAVTNLREVLLDYPTPMMCFPHVTNLRFSRGLIINEKLNRLLRYFTCLEKVHLEDHMYRWRSVNVDLSFLRHCLREVTMRDIQQIRGGMTAVLHRKSYWDFQKLEKMDVIAPHLEGWVVRDAVGQLPDFHENFESASFSRVIPRSVRILILTCCQGPVVRRVTMLLDTPWIDESKLEYLKFVCYKIDAEEIESCRNILEQRCKHAGIQLEIEWEQIKTQYEERSIQ